VKLTRVTFHDYRVYAGVQTVELSPPDATKPVILFGGLNGEGKTTFLEGIQLALYGRRSEVWDQNGTSYTDYLAQSIHRGADPSGGAMIEVEFEAIDQDQLRTFLVQRSWRVNGSGKAIEHVQIFIDGQHDQLVSETWGDQVERFIPARLAGLFFFDGEKIKHYADPQRSKELIERGLLSLLGIDLIDQLGVDLKVLETRIAKLAKIGPEDKASKELENARDALRSELDLFVELSASLETQHDQQLNTCEALDREYEKMGGKLFEQRIQLESNRRALVDKRAALERNLIEISAGALPLALVRATLAKCLFQMQVEHHAKGAKNTLEWTEKQNQRLFKLIMEKKVAKKTQEILREFYKGEAVDLKERANFPVYLETDEFDFLAATTVADISIAEEQEKSAKILGDLSETESRTEAIDRKLASVPDDDALAGLLSRREAARHKLGVLEGQKIQVKSQSAWLRTDLERLRQLSISTLSNS